MLKLLGGDTCTLGSGLRWFPGLETAKTYRKYTKQCYMKSIGGDFFNFFWTVFGS